MIKKIKALQDHTFLGPLGEELGELYIEYDCPEEAKGPSTDVRGYGIRYFVLCDQNEVGDWGGKEAEVAEMLTAHREVAIRAIGYIHAGSGLFCTQYYNSETFQEYQYIGLHLIEEWFGTNYEEEIGYIESLISHEGGE